MQRILRAIDRVESDLGAEIRLDDLSSIAGVSRYHFCRLFQSLCGWTVMGYVRARRLTEAAHRLHFTADPLVEIALDAGFGSQQAFTRAFSDFFGVPPGAVRKGTIVGLERLVPRVTEQTLAFLKEQDMMEPKFVEREAFAAIGMRGSFMKDDTEEIPALWSRVQNRWDDLLPVMLDGGIGACVADRENAGTFDYIAGVTAKPDAEPPAGMDKLVIAPQTYAVFTHRLTQSNVNIDIKPTIRHIFGTWFPNSDYSLVRSPDFEFYGERFDPQTMTGEIDFYVPVLK